MNRISTSYCLLELYMSAPRGMHAVPPPCLPLLFYPAIKPRAQGHTGGWDEHHRPQLCGKVLQQQHLASWRVPPAVVLTALKLLFCHLVWLLMGCLFLLVLIGLIFSCKCTQSSKKTVHPDFSTGNGFPVLPPPIPTQRSQPCCPKLVARESRVLDIPSGSDTSWC